MTAKKIKSLTELKKIVQGLKREDKKVVFTNGCFDVFHPGHLYYLEKVKTKGDILIVAVNSNDSIKRLKGEKRPLVDERERAEMLAALECVDWVTIFSEDTPGKVIRELKPDVLIKGGDYSLNEIVGRDFVESYKGKVLTVPLFKGWSSTKLIETILKKYG